MVSTIILLRLLFSTAEVQSQLCAISKRTFISSIVIMWICHEATKQSLVAFPLIRFNTSWVIGHEKAFSIAKTWFKPRKLRWKRNMLVKEFDMQQSKVKVKQWHCSAKKIYRIQFFFGTINPTLFSIQLYVLHY